jgi:hypothetical protein
VEPIQRIVGPRETLDGVAAAHRLAPVARDERPPDRERRRPRPHARPRPEPPADGRPHIDVQA